MLIIHTPLTVLSKISFQMPPNLPLFTADGSFYFLLLPQRQGNHGSYTHIAKIYALDFVDVSWSCSWISVTLIWRSKSLNEDIPRYWKKKLKNIFSIMISCIFRNMSAKKGHSNLVSICSYLQRKLTKNRLDIMVLWK